MFEISAVSEGLKGSWRRLEAPRAWICRDRDGRELGLLLECAGILHGVEVKLAAESTRA